MLTEKGYNVHGITRRIVGSERIKIHTADLTDSSAITSIIEKVRPDEIYNLAAESNVFNPFGDPFYTTDVNGVGVTRILDAIKKSELMDTIRLF